MGLKRITDVVERFEHHNHYYLNQSICGHKKTPELGLLNLPHRRGRVRDIRCSPESLSSIVCVPILASRKHIPAADGLWGCQVRAGRRWTDWRAYLCSYGKVITMMGWDISVIQLFRDHPHPCKEASELMVHQTDHERTQSFGHHQYLMRSETDACRCLPRKVCTKSGHT